MKWRYQVHWVALSSVLNFGQSYFVAETTMPGRSGFDFNGSSQSFNVLASYLFGKVFATFAPYVRSSLFCWLVWIIGENTKGLLLGCLPAERSFRANGNDYSCYYSEGWAQQWNDGHDNPGDNKEGESCMLLHMPLFFSCICLVIHGNLLLVRNWWSFTFPSIFFPPAVSWWK